MVTSVRVAVGEDEAGDPSGVGVGEAMLESECVSVGVHDGDGITLGRGVDEGRGGGLGGIEVGAMRETSSEVLSVLPAVSRAWRTIVCVPG